LDGGVSIGEEKRVEMGSKKYVMISTSDDDDEESVCCTMYRVL